MQGSYWVKAFWICMFRCRNVLDIGMTESIVKHSWNLFSSFSLGSISLHSIAFCNECRHLYLLLASAPIPIPSQAQDGVGYWRFLPALLPLLVYVLLFSQVLSSISLSNFSKFVVLPIYTLSGRWSFVFFTFISYIYFYFCWQLALWLPRPLVLLLADQFKIKTQHRFSISTYWAWWNIQRFNETIYQTFSHKHNSCNLCIKFNYISRLGRGWKGARGRQFPHAELSNYSAETKKFPASHRRCRNFERLKLLLLSQLSR